MNRKPPLLHGGDVTSFQKEHPGRPVLDFSANINPLGIPEGVRLAYRAALEGCADYPDPLCRDLRQAIAGFEGVPVDYVLCGNGASDIIYRIAFGLRPKRALLLAPTFAEYELALRAAGGELTYHHLCPERDFQVGQDILPALTGVDLVVLCNPNNPTGSLIGRELMVRIHEACRRQGTWLLVDECFQDFLPHREAHTLKGYLPENPRLILLGSFTKLFAIPGLRLGYGLLADEAAWEGLRRAGAPWSVSHPAQLCGVAAAVEADFVVRTHQLVGEQRTWLTHSLREIGFRVWDSQVNYILFYTERTDLHRVLRERGILIRDCSNYRGLTKGYYRVAVRGEADNHALIRAIKEL